MLTHFHADFVAGHLELSWKRRATHRRECASSSTTSTPTPSTRTQC
jgi:ribonuclease BN (tRNA processing enzyme)